jgi:subtilisin family serine protease
MKVLNVLLLVLLASSSSARVGSVQRALEPVNDTNPDEYLVIYDEGADDPQGLLKGLIMSGKAEILYNYTNIPAFAVKNVNLSALKNALKNVEGAQISTNDVATIDLVQSPVASWGLDRVDQMTGGLDLDDEYSYVRDGSNVDVYIIDTGIFIEHEDFGGRARLGADFTGEGNFDGNGHGSHVAGTLVPIFVIIRASCSLLLATYRFTFLTLFICVLLIPFPF